MAEVDAGLTVGVALSEPAQALVELAAIHRRFGQLEEALPNAWHLLTKTPDEELRSKLDITFLHLFDLMKGRK